MAGPPPPPMPAPSGPQANRTDLLAPVAAAAPPPGGGQPNGQPIQVPTGMKYGEAQQLEQAQQAVPLGQAPPVPQPGAQPGGQAGPPDIAAAMAAAKQMQPPTHGGIGRPTERPNEPVTAGLSGTPSAPNPRQVGSLSGMIDAVAKANNSAALSALAGRAAAAGQ